MKFQIQVVKTLITSLLKKETINNQHDYNCETANDQQYKVDRQSTEKDTVNKSA